MHTDYPRLARKITWTLFANQALGSTGFIAASTVTSIAGAALSGQAALAGLPSALYQTGAALSAFAWGYLMDRIGRRGGLIVGMLSGILGAAFAILAITVNSFVVFLFGMVLMGMANAAVQLSRYAAAEVNPPEARGRAIANVVLGGTLGAVFSYLLLGPASDLAKNFGYNELTGAFALAFVVLAFGMIVLSAGLRPEPRDLGRELARLYDDANEQPGASRARRLAQIYHQPAAFTAMLAMVVGQMVMVMLMVITSLHMKQHAHTLSDISLVISSHTIGMFAFSAFSGQLADRVGRGPVIMTGALALIFASLGATLSPDVFPLAGALFLLGLGWNFCFVGGSSLLSDQLSPAERARTQGFNDLLVGAASALGGLSSGFVFSAVGYDTMGVVAAIAACAPLLLATWWQMTRGNRQESVVGSH